MYPLARIDYYNYTFTQVIIFSFTPQRARVVSSRVLCTSVLAALAPISIAIYEV